MPVEVDIRWSVWREFCEEAYGAKELEGDALAPTHDYYLPDYPGVAWFHEGHRGGYRCETTAFGFNAMAGNYEFAMLLMVPDESYWNTFRTLMTSKSWEFDDSKGKKAMSLDEDQLQEILALPDWTSEALFQFVEGLLRIKKLEPERVRLPGLRRELAPIA